MHHNVLFVRGLVFAALVISLGGCSKPQYEVTGVVKYNGAPLNKPDGKIVFVGPDGSQVESAIGSDGAYKAKATAGTNRVVVYYPNPAFTKVARPKGAPTQKDRPAPSSPFLTPEVYSNAETSKLSVQIDKNTVFNADLTGPPIP
jgi:hypothetical protein